MEVHEWRGMSGGASVPACAVSWTSCAQSLVQGDASFEVEVNGKGVKTLDFSIGENWRNRRQKLTPAFSTLKMKLVSSFCLFLFVSCEILMCLD